MRTTEFQKFLDEENILRVRFHSERGQVISFVVQLECCFGSSKSWVPVVRYDTAHGFAHCDRLHPYKPTEKTKMLAGDYKQALTVAMDDLESNWVTYRRRYERWLSQQN
jgi:hypothetical protein